MNALEARFVLHAGTKGLFKRVCPIKEGLKYDPTVGETRFVKVIYYLKNIFPLSNRKSVRHFLTENEEDAKNTNPPHPPAVRSAARKRRRQKRPMNAPQLAAL